MYIPMCIEKMYVGLHRYVYIHTGSKGERERARV